VGAAHPLLDLRQPLSWIEQVVEPMRRRLPAPVAPKASDEERIGRLEIVEAQ
jgi:hypothetical protein